MNEFGKQCPLELKWRTSTLENELEKKTITKTQSKVNVSTDLIRMGRKKEENDQNKKTKESNKMLIQKYVGCIS